MSFTEIQMMMPSIRGIVIEDYKGIKAGTVVAVQGFLESSVQCVTVGIEVKNKDGESKLNSMDQQRVNIPYSLLNPYPNRFTNTISRYLLVQNKSAKFDGDVVVNESGEIIIDIRDAEHLELIGSKVGLVAGTDGLYIVPSKNNIELFTTCECKIDEKSMIIKANIDPGDYQLSRNVYPVKVDKFSYLPGVKLSLKNSSGGLNVKKSKQQMFEEEAFATGPSTNFADPAVFEAMIRERRLRPNMNGTWGLGDTIVVNTDRQVDIPVEELLG